MTQIGSVTREQVLNEQIRQQQLAIESQMKQQQRLDDVALPLLRAAVPICKDAITTRRGFRFANLRAFSSEYYDAARASGFTDTVTITDVTRGSAAERAGMRAGDRVLSANGQPVGFDASAAKDLASRMAEYGTSAITFVTRDDSATHTISVQADTVCAYDIQLVKSDDLNAAADGRTVYVTSAMLRFADDDDELATVVGHEIAHNAMHHLDAKKKNTLLGAIAGAVLDVAMASQGVNTQGTYTNEFAKAGATIFSQDFEREADYVGLYIAAGASFQIAKAPNLWRRMAQESPGSIKFASSHPTTAERFVRLDQWRGEIERKLAVGASLRPEMKNGVSAPVTQVARAPSRVRSTGPTSAIVAQANAIMPRNDTGASAKHAAAAPVQANSGSSRSLAPQPAKRPMGEPAPSGRESSKPLPRSDERMAIAIVGAPSSEADRVAGAKVFAEGRSYFDRQEWDKAENSFKKALRFDGSVAAYHAALGAVEMVLGHWEEAEAEYTAASLIDVDNQEYRAQIKEARRRRS